MKVDGAADAEGDTMVVEYDALKGEGHEEQVRMVKATKVEIEEIEEITGQTVTETLHAEAQTVVQ